MGKMSQKKGRTAELELCRILNDNGIPATPGTALCYGSEPDISGVKGFHCEVKRRERIEIGAWMKQATEDAKKFNDGWPCKVLGLTRAEVIRIGIERMYRETIVKPKMYASNNFFNRRVQSMSMDERFNEWIKPIAEEWEEQQRKEWFEAVDGELEEWIDKERERWGELDEREEEKFQEYIEEEREKTYAEEEEKFADWLSDHYPDWEAEMREKWDNINDG